MSSPDADTHFLRLGVQYYTAARSAVLAELSPVTGNLYHHAIEMLLKARLSQKRSLEELSRPPFGHKLLGLWSAFKAESPAAGLDQFDETVANLDPFEMIRYPDAMIEQGADIVIMWDPGSVSRTHAPGRTPEPRYHLVVTAIDRLVARIFEVSSRNPLFFTSGMNEYAKRAITRDNPARGVWFP